MKLQWAGVCGAGVPDDATSAWGARLVAPQDGYVSLLPDRRSVAKDGSDRILEVLNLEFRPLDLIKRVGDLLRSGEMQTHVAKEFVLYESPTLKVIGNTNASCGYCYVAAWVKAVEDEH